MPQDAAIYPGQGAQSVGMAKDVADAYSVAAETFKQADEVLGFELSRICFEGPEDRLGATDVQQPAILTTSVAIFRAAIDAGMIERSQFSAMGGLSLGEYSALHLSGAVSFKDALQLVYRRGQLMQKACEETQGGMVSIVGVGPEVVQEICDAVHDQGYIAPANYNCPGQIVVSGEKTACEAAYAKAESFGAKAVPLKVAGAFHSELMKPAGDALLEALDATEFRMPAVRVIGNYDAEYHDDADGIRKSLYHQVFGPVRWQACVERLIADGCDRMFEFGPGKVLTGLMRKIDRKVKAINVSTADRIKTDNEN